MARDGPKVGLARKVLSCAGDFDFVFRTNLELLGFREAVGQWKDFDHMAIPAIKPKMLWTPNQKAVEAVLYFLFTSLLGPEATRSEFDGCWPVSGHVAMMEFSKKAAALVAVHGKEWKMPKSLIPLTQGAVHRHCGERLVEVLCALSDAALRKAFASRFTEIAPPPKPVAEERVDQVDTHDLLWGMELQIDVERAKNKALEKAYQLNLRKRGVQAKVSHRMWKRLAGESASTRFELQSLREKVKLLQKTEASLGVGRNYPRNEIGRRLRQVDWVVDEVVAAGEKLALLKETLHLRINREDVTRDGGAETAQTNPDPPHKSESDESDNPTLANFSRLSLGDHDSIAFELDPRSVEESELEDRSTDPAGALDLSWPIRRYNSSDCSLSVDEDVFSGLRRHSSSSGSWYLGAQSCLLSPTQLMHRSSRSGTTSENSRSRSAGTSETVSEITSGGGVRTQEKIHLVDIFSVLNERLHGLRDGLASAVGERVHVHDACRPGDLDAVVAKRDALESELERLKELKVRIGASKAFLEGELQQERSLIFQNPSVGNERAGRLLECGGRCS